MDAMRVTPQLVKTYNLSSNNGLLVDKIHSGSPAYNTGIRPGDIVISINDVMVTDRHSSASQIADIMPGQPIKLAVLRGNKTFSVTAVAGTRKSRN
jgi:S1-C subfamily serine protease